MVIDVNLAKGLSRKIQTSMDELIGKITPSRVLDSRGTVIEDDSHKYRIDNQGAYYDHDQKYFNYQGQVSKRKTNQSNSFIRADIQTELARSGLLQKGLRKSLIFNSRLCDEISPMKALIVLNPPS